MMNKNSALIQEWQIFKTFCPESILTKIKGKDVDATEYYNISNAVLFLGFSEICDEMLENAPTEFEVERESWNKKSGISLDIKEIDYICSLFIKEIKSYNLQRLFESSKYFYIREYEFYQKFKKPICS